MAKEPERAAILEIALDEAPLATNGEPPPHVEREAMTDNTAPDTPEADETPHAEVLQPICARSEDITVYAGERKELGSMAAE